MTQDLGLGAAFLAITVALGWVVKAMLSRARLRCQFCSEPLSPLDELDPSDRRQILEYFVSHEHRQPKAAEVQVCAGCRTVHDDFSGERRSRDVDAVAGVVTNMTFCKVCNALVRGCDLEATRILCRHCGTPYRWEIHGTRGWRFLAPPAGAAVLPECRDAFGVG